MKYLAMLKSEKRPPALLQKLQKAPKPPETELQKLQKPPFYSYCTTEGRGFQKTQSSRAGLQWCQDHRGDLLSAGWTEKELFNPRWPLGLAHLALWDKPGLQVVLDDGNVRFRWETATGSTVEQVGRPGAVVARALHLPNGPKQNRVENAALLLPRKNQGGKKAARILGAEKKR